MSVYVRVCVCVCTGVGVCVCVYRKMLIKVGITLDDLFVTSFYFSSLFVVFILLFNYFPYGLILSPLLPSLSRYY